MAQYLGTVQLGGFYYNGAALPRPTKPWRPDTQPVSGVGVGDIPQMSGSMANYTLGDTPSAAANRLQWHKIEDGNKTLYICDRVILVYVSWINLSDQGYITGKTVTIDGKKYKCRLITGGDNFRNISDAYAGGTPIDNEWDRFITNEENVPGLPVPAASDLDSTKAAADQTGVHNQFWNWFGVYSWCQEIFPDSPTTRVYRGYPSARYWGASSRSVTAATFGFRPVLEELNETYVPVILGATLTPNPSQVGEPVLVSVNAAEIVCVPSPMVWTAGELTAGQN